MQVRFNFGGSINQSLRSVAQLATDGSQHEVVLVAGRNSLRLNVNGQWLGPIDYLPRGVDPIFPSSEHVYIGQYLISS